MRIIQQNIPGTYPQGHTSDVNPPRTLLRLAATPSNSCWGACHVTPFVCHIVVHSGGGASERLPGRVARYGLFGNTHDDGVAHLKRFVTRCFGYSVFFRGLQTR